jgi:hypothetical protein
MAISINRIYKKKTQKSLNNKQIRVSINETLYSHLGMYKPRNDLNYIGFFDFLFIKNQKDDLNDRIYESSNLIILLFQLYILSRLHIKLDHIKLEVLDSSIFKLYYKLDESFDFMCINSHLTLKKKTDKSNELLFSTQFKEICFYLIKIIMDYNKSFITLNKMKNITEIQNFIIEREKLFKIFFL